LKEGEIEKVWSFLAHYISWSHCIYIKNLQHKKCSVILGEIFWGEKCVLYMVVAGGVSFQQLHHKQNMLSFVAWKRLEE
jgi:hypothetical protein